MIRTGIGYDVHPFKEGRKLMLGGVHIPYYKGLEGHSDADALIHAICDAVLGAMGLNDIGHLFPSTDPRWKDCPSKVFLEYVRDLALSKGCRVLNVDATVIAEEPKIAPHIARMKEVVASALGIKPHEVNIKATTNEGLGFIGRGEGIACLAVATVDVAF